MCKKSNPLLLLAMVFVVVGLLLALMPVSDFDQDGHLDSLVTEGFLVISMPYSVSGLFSLLISLTTTCLIAPQVFFTLLVPPPITTK